MPLSVAIALKAVFRSIAALCLIVFATGVAWSHASLGSSQPGDGAVIATPPTNYLLTFSEPVSPLALRLIKPDGTATTLDDFVLRDRTLEISAPDGLGTGTHVLTWRVVSEDGHPVGGSVIFSIGEPSARAPSLEDGADPAVRRGLWLAKIGLYAGLFFGVGGAFAIRVLMPDVKHGRAFISTMLALGVAASLASAGFQGLDALGATIDRMFAAEVWSTGFGTTFGRTVVLGMAACVVAAIALGTTGRSSKFAAWASLLLAGFALTASGHASAASPQWLMRSAVFLHVVTVAAWIGALVPLGLALTAGSLGARASLSRFSRAMPLTVGILVAAGITLALVQVGEPRALLDTDYGNVLLVKLSLLVLLFLLVAANRWLFTAPVQAGDPMATRRMVRSIATETLLAVAILGAVAAWRFTPPPRMIAAMAAEPASVHIHAAAAMADLTVTPGRAGVVQVSAVIMTGDFGALDAKEVTFVFSDPDAGIESFRRKASKPGDGTWRAEAVTLPLPGKWKVRLDVLINDFEIARLEGELDVRP